MVLTRAYVGLGNPRRDREGCDQTEEDTAGHDDLLVMQVTGQIDGTDYQPARIR